MAKTREEYLTNVQSRIDGAKSSTLAMAAPLESSGSSSHKPKPQPTSTVAAAATAPTETKKPRTQKELNQKAGLLIALLSVGALEPAFTILTKFPWLVDSHPEVADLLIQIIKCSIAPLYEEHVASKERNTGFSHPRARYGMTGVIPAPVRKPNLTLIAPTPPCTSNNEFVFFFPDWTTKVPVCNTLDDMQDVIEPLLGFTGVHISRDTWTLSRIIRLGRAHIQSTVSDHSYSL
jgi:THO complex subunit 2